MAEAASIRRAVRWVIPAGIVLAVVAALLLRTLNASGAETDRYATATVTRGTVTESYVGSGAVTKVKQGSASFPASATVTKVNVAVGDKVEAGDTLASIDDSDLRIAVITAKQTLAEAKVTLQHAEDAAELATSNPSASATATPSASSTAGTGNRNVQPSDGAPSADPSSHPTGTRPSSSRPAPTSTASPTGGASQPPTLAELEAAVRAAQAELAAAQSAAATALTAQQSDCAALSTTAPSSSPTPTGATPTATVTPSATATPSSTATGTPSGSATATPSSTGTATPSATTTSTATPSATASATPSVTTTPVASVSPAELAACIAALVKTQQAQQGVASTQAQLDPLVAALVAAATQNPSPSPNPTNQSPSNPNPTNPTPTTGNPSNPNPTTGNPGAQPTEGTGSGTGSGRENPAPSSDRAGSGSQPSSSDQLAGNGQGAMTVGSAEAAVTKAELALTTAEKQLEAATMRAPISGTVAAIPFKTGDIASTSDAVVIIGKGAVSVEMSVPEAAFRTLEVGQTATVTTPGGGKATGKVTQLGLLPTASTSGSSTSTFPVTVVASGRAASTLPAGAAATVTVALKTSADAIVAPVSAVTRAGTSGTVQVLQNGTVTKKDVTLGAIGSATVEVTDGLSPGDVLVIADNTVALPTNSSNRGLRPGGGRVVTVEGAPGGGQPPGTR